MSKKADGKLGSCKKICFKTKREAQKAITRINKENVQKTKFVLKSVYFCEEHRAWHVSSMTKKLAALIDEKKETRENLKNPSVSTIQNRIEYLKKVPKIRNKFN